VIPWKAAISHALDMAFPSKQADNIDTEMTIDERIEFLMQSIESHDRQIGQLTERAWAHDARMTRIEDALEKLVRVSSENATATRAPALIAEAHERRIAGLVGPNQSQ
jgi:hypothetical protein